MDNPSLQDRNSYPSSVNRRLAAIAFADVAGFSHLMEQNDVETVGKWKLLRDQILQPHMKRHGGRLAETSGDALLVEFSSAVDAVAWAIDVQRTIHDQNTASDSQPLNLRIGVNVDDLIDDDGILQGDGVNIAARIHQAAEPGQIVVTATVCEFVMHRLSATFRDLGSPKLKNITRPVRVFVVEWGEGRSNAVVPQPYLGWSMRPTLAVLPFRNISGIEEDRYFGEGITEDIITGMSRSRSLYVIARASTLRYRDRDKDVSEIADELNVRYILDGSVRRQASRLRISTELIDVANNRPVWAERFDGAVDDLFEFQDLIASRVAGSLEPSLQAIETARIGGRPTESLGAYDCVLKTMSKLYDFTQGSYDETGALLDRAIMLDPSYAQAYAYKAWRLNFWIGEGHSKDQEKDKALAVMASQRSIELDSRDAFGLAVAGHVSAFLDGKPEEAIELFDQSLIMNENLAFAWAMSALTKAYCGLPDEALERLQNVWRLSPFDPQNFYFWIVAGISEFVAGRYDQACAWLYKSKRANHRFIACLRMLAASLALAGNEQEAKIVGRELLAVDPTFRVSTFLEWYPLQRAGDLAKLAEGLKKAGLPE